MKKRKKKYKKRSYPEVRLIGLDLDGTTLTSDKVLTPHTKEVLEDCLADGIHVLPATGRVHAGIPDYLRQIRGMRYVILSNGACVMDLQKEEVLYRNCIPWDRALDLFDTLEKYHTFYDVYANGEGWCEGRFLDHLDEFRIEPEIQKLVRMSRNRVDDLREWMRQNQAPVEKLNMFFAEEEERQRAYSELSEMPDLAVTCSLSNNLEINHASCNKGDAMKNLGRILQIPLENMMACGDGNNDLEMIKQAGIGVAMANGEKALKKVADYITKTNDEEGVAYAIEHFCNQKGKRK